MSVLPSPVAQWDEPPSSGAAGTLVRLAPYLTLEGLWLYLAPNEVPAGAIAGARVDSGSGYDVMLTTTTTGLRVTQNPAGVVFFY
jgi:hypothetical protein